MPQMSPLFWLCLMFFFILFYLVLSVSIYYEFRSDLLGGQKNLGTSLVKFFFNFN